MSELSNSLGRKELLAIGARGLSWILAFTLVYLLRSFFLLIFLTFVFSYLQCHAVDRLALRIKSRRVRVLIVAASLFLLLVLVGVLLIPLVKEQATVVADKFPSYLEVVDEKIIKLSKKYSLLEDVLREKEHSPSLQLLSEFFGLSTDKPSEGVKDVLKILRTLGKELISIGSAFFLALLFSFLIILDLPRITAGIKSLAETRLAFFYNEVSPSIHKFGTVLGQTLQAQLLIALANTVLTAGILIVLGLASQLAFLSVIVFLCSFIPVAGVFISSIPICVFALGSSGVNGLIAAIVLIWFIHLIEAYFLNPRIFGQQLKINPVFVLIILTVAGKLFHFWGLILGVPMCSYFFQYAIRHEET